MKTLTLEPAGGAGQVRAVRDAVAGGQVVAVPTDTVYGLVCDGRNEAAKERIYRIKGRPAEKTLIGFVAGVEEARRFAAMDAAAARLAVRRWPGPHTFVFRSAADIPFLTTPSGTIGLRSPDHPFLRDLLARVDILASTSANPSGAPAPASAAEIAPSVREAVDLVVDGGRTGGTESSVWDLSRGAPRLIRGSVLFVCEGNSCRSPMAEFLLRAELGGGPVRVSSAGMSVLFPGPISPEAARVLFEEGIVPGPFASRRVDRGMLDAADLVFVMEQSQKDRISALFPGAGEKVAVLGIPDPAGGDAPRYRQVREMIRRSIEAVVMERIVHEDRDGKRPRGV